MTYILSLLYFEKKIAHFCSFSRYCDFMKKLQQKKIYLYFKNLVTIVSTVWTTITFNAINKVCSIKTPNIGLFFSFLILCNVTIFPQKDSSKGHSHYEKMPLNVLRCCKVIASLILGRLLLSKNSRVWTRAFIHLDSRILCNSTLLQNVLTFQERVS